MVLGLERSVISTCQWPWWANMMAFLPNIGFDRGIMITSTCSWL
jgi:hypothetical protein